MAPLAGFTALIATRIQDAAGNLMTGALIILPTDGTDQPIGTTAGGVGGPIAAVFAAPISFAGGILAANAQVADTATTANQHISYRFVFQDATGKPFLTWTGVQPSGPSFNLDTYTPPNAPQTVVTPGPPGAPGVPGQVSYSALQATALYTNVLDPATLVQSSFVFANSGAVAAAGAGFTSDGVVSAKVSGGQWYYATKALSQLPSDNVGYAWYSDAAGTAYIGGSSAATAAGAVFQAPQNAQLLKMTIQSSDILASAMMLIPYAVTNLINPATLVQATFLSSNNGNNYPAAGGYTGDGVVGPITVAPGTQYLSTKALSQLPGSGVGYAWYSDAGATVYLSGSDAAVPAYTSITAPAGAASLKLTIQSADVLAGGEQWVVVPNVASIPSVYVPPGPNLSTALAAISAVQTQLASVATGSSISTLQAQVTAFQATKNYFDPSSITLSSFISQSTGQVLGAGSGYGNYTASGWIRCQPGVPLYLTRQLTGIGGSDVCCYAEYNAAKAYVRGGGNAVIAPGTAVTPGPGTFYLRATFQASDSATMMALLKWPAPSVYVPFEPDLDPSALAGAFLTQPLIGKRFGCFMDSYGGLFHNMAPAAIAATLGMSFAFADSRTGRWCSQMFENYYGSGGTSVNAANGNTTGSIGPDGTTASMSNGTTLAQDLANVDVLMIALGTNPDFNGSGGAQNLGAFGDPTTAQTTYGSIARDLTTVLTAKPTIQLFWVTPWQFSGTAYGSTPPPNTVGILQAIHDVCGQFGVPVLDLYKNLPVNPLTWGTYLGSDGVHPSPAGFSLYQNYIARQMAVIGHP